MVVDSDWMSVSGGPPVMAPQGWTGVADVDDNPVGRDATRCGSSCVRTILAMGQSAAEVETESFVSLSGGPGGPPERVVLRMIVRVESDGDAKLGVTE